MKGFPYLVIVDVEQAEFRAILNWLHDTGHVLRETMVFGANDHKTGSTIVTQRVYFKDKKKARVFKMVWTNGQ